MSYLTHLVIQFDINLETLGHMTWKLLKTEFSFKKYTMEEEDWRNFVVEIDRWMDG